MEANFPEDSETTPLRIVTAGKDGSINVWKVLGDIAAAGEDRLSFVAEAQIDEPLSKVKWLNDKTILASSTYGNLFQLKLEKDDQRAEFVSRPKLLFTTEHEVAIWDFTVLSVATQQTMQVWLAEDSGKVTELSLGADLQITGTKTTHVSLHRPQSFQEDR